jgi:hypothetical protein
MEARFFASLQTNETLKYLSKYVEDPDSSIKRPIRQLYVFCRGITNQDKYEILNACLVWFSKSFVKLEFRGVDLSDDLELFVRAQYQPNTVAKSFRCLFAVFRSNQLIYSLAKDFNGKGTFIIFYILLLCVKACRLIIQLLYLFILTF